MRRRHRRAGLLVMWCSYPYRSRRGPGRQIDILSSRNPNNSLPREVSEGLVGVGHAVHILALGVCRAFLVVGGRQLLGQLLKHRTALLFADREIGRASCRERG